MYKDGNGKTHRNLAHIMINFNGGWCTEVDLRPLYAEWYGQFLKEETIKRRLLEMLDGGYCIKADRQRRHKTHTSLLRCFKLTKKGERLIKVRMVA